ncbi:L-piperidine-6-carboxylate dehydrogenase [Arthrobacter rhombi]|uniref:L-piperidine-6-carboxylate dehydrogenase n=1 Tax=Arthrobacter rhombi TaxID=71253 RepID=UPI003FD24634
MQTTETRQDNLLQSVESALTACGVTVTEGEGIGARSPLTGQTLKNLKKSTEADLESMIGQAQEAFTQWRDTPAPVRGALVKRWGELLTEHKEDLGVLVTAEAGKITSEANGEVQEMIDICELAVGLSRQLFGKTMPSERKGHRLMETWHPLGVVGIITAFNFPVAPYAWNTAVALVCGNAIVWKPSEMTTLSALATDALLARAVKETGAPAGLHHVLLADRELGSKMVSDSRFPLISATGSTRMGRTIAPRIAERFGSSILELGGNNAAIVAPSADLDLALRGVAFAAVGTAGQRCTSMRRLIAHESVADQLVDSLAKAYPTLQIGSPMEPDTLVGPLVNQGAYENMQQAIKNALAEGGELVCGGDRVLADEYPDAFYVEPAIIRMPSQTATVKEETFAPILYVMTYTELDDAIEMHNAVPQGLSSAIFTQDQGEAERFISSAGSDCGIANVNIGTSGAEIGGAFGGEKETGGGRESGSDAWRGYMRRATNTVNYSGELPLAQGVEFL